MIMQYFDYFFRGKSIVKISPWPFPQAFILLAWYSTQSVQNESNQSAGCRNEWEKKVRKAVKDNGFYNCRYFSFVMSIMLILNSKCWSTKTNLFVTWPGGKTFSFRETGIYDFSCTNKHPLKFNVFHTILV